jgi:hypothetical protein
MVAAHAERLGGLQFHHFMSWPEVLDIPRALGSGLRLNSAFGCRHCRKQWHAPHSGNFMARLPRLPGALGRIARLGRPLSRFGPPGRVSENTGHSARSATTQPSRLFTSAAFAFAPGWRERGQ